jgi:hypothetical protein
MPQDHAMGKKKTVPRPPFPKPPIPWVGAEGPFFPSPDNVFSAETAGAFNRDLTKHEAAVALGKKSVEKRRGAPSRNPINKFMTEKLDRDPDISSADMVAALKDATENDGRIEMSDDDTAFVVMGNGKEKYRLKITSVPSTISKLKQKLILTRTGSN